MSKSNEWYTPAKYIEAAREVMGRIDLDPASCQEANEIVKATQYYDKTQNGLMHPWHGCVWLNPPYGKLNNKSLIWWFVNRLIREYQEGNIEQAILLVDCDPDTQWFQPLWNFPISFPDHKVYFYCPDQTHLLQRTGLKAPSFQAGDEKTAARRRRTRFPCRFA